MAELTASENIEITQPGGSGTDVLVAKKQDSGFFDYNDAATAITPISVTGGGASVPLTNDEQGVFTNKLYPPAGVTDVWNESTGLFDFTELTLGSRMHYRLDFDVTITGNNAELDTMVELAIGGSPYQLTVDREYFKGAGTYNITVGSFIYIGDTNTKNNGARFVVSSSNNASIVVNGWACYITTY